MALPSSGPISLSQVNVELGRAATTTISMNESAVRGLFGIVSGAISMQDGRGKSSQFAFTISANQINANLRTLALNAGWNGTSKVIATVNSGVYVYSTANTTAGLTIDGSWPGGVELINNGFIIGMGGNGGTFNAPASVGGSALSLGVNVTITNNSYIAGGGGGGGGWDNCGGGGGAGGGAGGWAAGAGGAVGSSGSNGSVSGSGSAGGGGGGRVLPGTGGASVTAPTSVLVQNIVGLGGGSGGSGAAARYPAGMCQPGVPRITNAGAGGGGGWGAAGGTAIASGGACANNVTITSGAGGSNNSVGGNGTVATSQNITTAAGAAGGRSVQLNGFSVTWLATGTRWGAIS